MDTTLSPFTPAEVEFLAEGENVEIVPNVRMDTLHLICGDYGPFLPQVPIKVPAWLGIALKKRGKCRIQIPDWMSAEKLAQALDAEKEAPVEFQPLPFHYIELARLVLVNETELQNRAFEVRTKVEDVQNVRRDKIDNGFPKLSGATHAVKMKNLSAMEVNQIRPFSMLSLDTYFKLDNEISATDNADDDHTAVAANVPRRVLRPR